MLHSLAMVDTWRDEDESEFTSGGNDISGEEMYIENAEGLELNADSHNPDEWGAIPTNSSTVLTSLREYSLLLGKEELTASIQTIHSSALPSNW